MARAPDRSVRWLPEEAGWRRFELTSRGDRVMARLREARADCLAVVLADDAAGVKPLEGCATLTLDLPLLGTRASPKWTERLRRVLREGPAGAADAMLLSDFREQAAADVAAALDVCAGLEAPPGRVGLLGLGAGACAAPTLAEREPRLAAFVLAPSGLAGVLDPEPALAALGRPCHVVADAAAAAARLREALA